jgi:branched-subunit amino acid ABC-type transport system permease component
VVLGTLNVVSFISLLFIAALGLAVIFGVMGVVNLAHGEFIMMGAYVSYLVAHNGLPVLISLMVAPVIVGLFALLLEPFLFRHLYGKLMESILATWGLSIALRQAFLLGFGSGYKSVQYPTDATISVMLRANSRLASPTRRNTGRRRLVVRQSATGRDVSSMLLRWRAKHEHGTSASENVRRDRRLGAWAGDC